MRNRVYNYPRREDIRTANIVADDPEGVTCLVIDRESFNQLISGLDEIRTKYVDDGKATRKCVIHLFFFFRLVVSPVLIVRLAAGGSTTRSLTCS